MGIPRIAGAKASIPAAATSMAPQSGVHTGAEARERALREADATAKAREARAMGQDFIAYNRLRFNLDKPDATPKHGLGPRTMADVIFLDKSWDDLYWIYEHMIYTEGQGRNYYLCSHEMNNCRVCATQKGYNGGPMEKGSYMMHCTIIDYTPETLYDGTQVEFRKRPLALTNQLHKEVLAIMTECMAKHGTIRGMMILMERDDSFNSAVGRPVMRPDGAMYTMVPEADLVAEFSHEEERADDGSLVKPKDFDLQPYDYSAIFPKLDQEYLAKMDTLFGAASGAVGTGRASSAPGTPPRTRSRSSYAASTAPGANATAQSQNGAVHDEDDGTRSAPSVPTSAATVPRVRSRASATAPVAAPTGVPVQPGSVPRTRTRPIGNASANGIPRATAGVDDDIPWTTE